VKKRIFGMKGQGTFVRLHQRIEHPRPQEKGNPQERSAPEEGETNLGGKEK